MQLSSFAVQLAGGPAAQLLQKYSFLTHQLLQNAKLFRWSSFSLEGNRFYKTKPRNTYPNLLIRATNWIPVPAAGHACVLLTRIYITLHSQTVTDIQFVHNKLDYLKRSSFKLEKKKIQNTPNHKPSVTSQLGVFTDRGNEILSSHIPESSPTTDC